MSVCSSLALGFLSSAAGQILEKKCLWGTNVCVCVCWGVVVVVVVLVGAEGLETAVVGGVNPTHYNSSLWPVLGKSGLQGPTATSYQYVFPPFHLSKWPLTAATLTSLSSQSLCQHLIRVTTAGSWCKGWWWWWCRIEGCECTELTEWQICVCNLFFFFTLETKACTVRGPRRMECCNVRGQEQHNGSLLI